MNINVTMVSIIKEMLVKVNLSITTIQVMGKDAFTLWHTPEQTVKWLNSRVHKCRIFENIKNVWYFDIISDIFNIVKLLSIV